MLGFKETTWEKCGTNKNDNVKMDVCDHSRKDIQNDYVYVRKDWCTTY